MEETLPYQCAPKGDVLEATEAILRAGMASEADAESYLFRVRGGEQDYKPGANDLYMVVGAKTGVAIAIDWDDVRGFASRYAYCKDLKKFVVLDHVDVGV